MLVAWCLSFDVFQQVSAISHKLWVHKFPGLEYTVRKSVSHAFFLTIKTCLIAIDFLPIIAVSHFVKVVLVQLTYKACEIAMLEVLGQYGSGEFVGILDNKRCAFIVPAKCVFECLVFQHSTATVSYYHRHLMKCRIIGIQCLT